MESIERSGRVVQLPIPEEKGGGREASPLPATRRAQLPPPDPNPPAPKARLTIVGSVHHQSPNGEITSAELSASQRLDSDEQPYVRHTRLATTWTPLRLDWIEHPRMVVIRNKGLQFLMNPTDEQRRQAEEASLEVGIDIGVAIIPFAIVGPWESLAFCPDNPPQIAIRAVNTVVPISVYAFPR